MGVTYGCVTDDGHMISYGLAGSGPEVILML